MRRDKLLKKRNAKIQAWGVFLASLQIRLKEFLIQSSNKKYTYNSLSYNWAKLLSIQEYDQYLLMSLKHNLHYYKPSHIGMNKFEQFLKKSRQSFFYPKMMPII